MVVPIAHMDSESPKVKKPHTRCIIARIRKNISFTPDDDHRQDPSSKLENMGKASLCGNLMNDLKFPRRILPPIG